MLSVSLPPGKYAIKEECEVLFQHDNISISFKKDPIYSLQYKRKSICNM